ncbi:MAG: phosphate/phosphite/phosphonate ABC transporter substrate-binding protein, partial [Candidatus Rokubacteria bacterium]|nr:phosphate/phosphite/phosphonate ABC transporter substrate-binding protein [Candidatus Rokubacteria bacterium]
MRTPTAPRLWSFALIALLVATAAAAFAAEPCAHRGKLDALFCDEDRDLIADPPKDPSKLVSP